MIWQTFLSQSGEEIEKIEAIERQLDRLQKDNFLFSFYSPWDALLFSITFSFSEYCEFKLEDIHFVLMKYAAMSEQRIHL